jgi:hypothetical protein
MNFSYKMDTQIYAQDMRMQEELASQFMHAAARVSNF